MADEDAWRLDGVPIAYEPEEEIRTFEALELSVLVPVEIVREVLRDVQPNAGNVEHVPTADGGYIAVDQSDGGNEHTLQPPADRQDVRRQLEWVAAAEYDEEILSSDGGKMQVDLTLVPQRSKRQYSGHEDDVVEEGDWELDVDAGRIATPNPDPEINESTEAGAEVLEMTFYLDGQQVRKVEESLRRLNAVEIREQVDGEPVAVDNSQDQVNTFYVGPPAEAQVSIDAGWYIALDYATVYQGGGAYEVEIAAVRKRDMQFHFDSTFGPTFDRGPFEPRSDDY